MSTVRLAERVSGSPDVISMSLDAGLEIEKSRLGHRYSRTKIKKFGQMLRNRALLEANSKAFADPGFVSPIHQLYRQQQGENNATMEVLYDFLDKIAKDFEAYDPNMSPEKKRDLVALCARLHRFLSDEFRGDEDSAQHGWWH